MIDTLTKRRKTAIDHEIARKHSPISGPNPFDTRHFCTAATLYVHEGGPGEVGSRRCLVAVDRQQLLGQVLMVSVGFYRFFYRFLDLNPDQQATADAAWVPFGGGARNCIGFALAQMELTLIISRLAQRLDRTLIVNQLPPPVDMIVNRPHNGVPMKVPPLWQLMK